MSVYLVVGGSGGIGNALVKNLLGKGHKVYSVSRNIPEIAHPELISFSCDVLSPDPLPEIKEPLNGLVYAPGSVNLRPFTSLKQTDFQNDMSINLYGAVRVLQNYLPALKKAGDASVVMFSTVAVQLGLPYHASVAAAKGAVEGLIRSLAAEFAPAIRVNGIAPSLTDTQLAGKLLNTDEKRKMAAERHPLKRYGSADEIAETAAFLLSPAGSWITGQIIHADGGLSSLKV
ncbi:MAG: SDR family oxidoreductase [Ignavibacteriaceae bacterium]|nr:SDR family oxidoreductase [Ignavibacteriaceae bacterium]